MEYKCQTASSLKLMRWFISATCYREFTWLALMALLIFTVKSHVLDVRTQRHDFENNSDR